METAILRACSAFGDRPKRFGIDSLRLEGLSRKRMRYQSMLVMRRGLPECRRSPPVVYLGQVDVVGAAHQAQVLGIVLASISERVSVVKLQVVPGRAAPPLLVD